MGKRRLALALGVILVMLVISGFTMAHVSVSPELQWRLHLVAAKIRGEVSEIPLHNLIVWLRPGSPFYLAALAQIPTPHAAIHTRLVGREDVRQGHDFYGKYCSACHGDRGRGHLGPSLINAVGDNSDWSFFSTVKWGLTGTSMQAQPLGDAQIWQVHAYVRSEAFATAAQPSGPASGAAIRRKNAVRATTSSRTSQDSFRRIPGQFVHGRNLNVVRHQPSAEADVRT